MRVPISWLRDLVQTDATAAQIADALTGRGLTVDALEVQPMPARIVVGNVLELRRHPNADRLRVGKVDVGRETLQIVTGADNVAAGNRVPIALVGASVYEHGSTDGARATTKVIAKSALRGVDSEGMMCSADELALPGEFPDGIIIMEDEAEVGLDFWRVARYGEGVLDIDVPANRPDCLSIVGLAREAAAALGATFLEPHLGEFAGDAASPIQVEIADPSVCRRFVGQHFSGLRPRRSPMWMTLRLHAAGTRSLGYWIDVSNYVQFETGQPLHAYDAAKIEGARLTARAARAGETLVTLDGVKRELPEGTPVIADGRGPVGIAGVFGGASTAVSNETAALFLEAANFVGPRIRRAGVALGLRTEAAIRHEKNLPLELSEFARRHAARLMTEAGAVASRVVDAGAKPAAERKVSIRAARVNRLLGTDLGTEEIRRALEPLGFRVSGDVVAVPYWRGDVTEEVDLIEEVARGVGYERIPARSTNASPQAVDQGLFHQERTLARAAAMLGYREVVTISLMGERVESPWRRAGVEFWSDAVRVSNPLSEDQRELRPSLLPGLLAMASRAWLTERTSAKLFEAGHIFRSADPAATPGEGDEPGACSENGVREWPSLGAIAVFADGDDTSALDARLREVAGDACALIRRLSGNADLRLEMKPRAYYHPGASALVRIGDRSVAKFGRVHPRLARVYELPPHTYAFFLYLERLPLTPPVQVFTPLPRFPGTVRDLAVVVDEKVSAGELIDAIRAAGTQTLESVTAFDEYRGPQIGASKKSIALSVRLRKVDATITDAEADAAVEAIVKALAAKFGAIIRGPA